MSEWNKWRLNFCFVAVIVYALNNWIAYTQLKQLEMEVHLLKTNQKEHNEVPRHRLRLAAVSDRSPSD